MTSWAGQRLAQEILTGLPGGFWGFIIIANIAVFLLGINLEFIEITFIAMPIFVPAVRVLFETGVTPFDTLPALMIWFTVMIAINLNMAFISPPVGFSLFYLQSVAPPEVRTVDIHRGALPFMALQGRGAGAGDGLPGDGHLAPGVRQGLTGCFFWGSNRQSGGLSIPPTSHRGTPAAPVEEGEGRVLARPSDSCSI